MKIFVVIALVVGIFLLYERDWHALILYCVGYVIGNMLGILVYS